MFLAKIQRIAIAASALTAVTFSGYSASADMPDIIYPVPGEDVTVNNISANGNWGLSSYRMPGANNSGGTLFDLTATPVSGTPVPNGVNLGSVSDDGNLFAANRNGRPAVYNRATDSYTDLPIPEGFSAGSASSITADGEYVLGSLSPSGNDRSRPAVWKIADLSVRTANNLPVLDMQNSTTSTVRIHSVAAGGRYLLGGMGNQYLLPIHMCSFLYDLDTQTYEIIGFTEKEGEPYPPGHWNYGDPIWEHHHPDLMFIEGARFSSNGKWITGTAYMRENLPDVYYAPEYRVSYRMNVDTRELEFFDASGEQDMAGSCVGDDGTLYTYTPALNPYSYGQVRYGKYFFSIDNLLKQIYGMDLEDYGIVNSGKPLSVSRDGRVMIMQNTPDNQYILRFKKPLTEICADFDMLGTYTLTPQEGVSITAAGLFQLNFTRDIESNGRGQGVKLVSVDGSESYSPVSQGGFNAFEKTLSVQFRNITLTQGKEYELVIPAGAFWVAGDRERTNKEIRLKYYGRGEQPVVFTRSAPESGTSTPGIDLIENPVLLYFDSEVMVNSSATSKPTIKAVGDEEPFAEINLLSARTADKHSVLLSPAGTIRLYQGTDYEITVPANSVTDLSGYGANEEFTIRFSGSYVMDPSQNGILFSAEGNDFTGMLFFEGDERVPLSEPASMNFTQSTTPWWVVRDENSTDMAYASHSMYVDGGQADDWMTTEQLFLPDEKVTLEFDSQSYRFDKTDRLKVIVYERRTAINALTRSIVEEIRENGVVVYDEIQSPGASEDLLAGDWRHNVISLKDFAGKYVYICFLNDNTDQSMVMVDNILVKHDMNIGIELRDALTVVDCDDFAVRGNLYLFTAPTTVTDIRLTLLDSKGTKVSEINETCNMESGSTYSFAFPEPLPLEPGEANDFSIMALLTGEGDALEAGYAGKVLNLSFQPERRVVLEKYTGRDCGFCPSGIVATQRLEQRFGDSFLPIAIHTFSGDPKGAGMGEYMGFLGCEALGAPSGRVNRGQIIPPAYTDQSNGAIRFSKTECLDGTEPILWEDIVADAMLEPTFLAIESKVTAASDKEVMVASNIESAIHLNYQNIRVFAVLLEDGLIDYQTNYYSQYNDDAMADWALGGKYGTGRVTGFECNNVARNTWGYSFNGTAGLLPIEFHSGDKYTVFSDVKVPSYIDDLKNCHVVVMLIDGNTGSVINAANASVATFINSVEEITTITDEPEEWFDLQGHRVENPGNGIYILRKGGKTLKVAR